MYTEITSASLHQRGKMQHGILSDHHWLPAGDHFIIYRWREIRAGDGDEGILFKEDLRAREMDLDHGLVFIVSYQQVRHLGGIAIHCSAGVYAHAAVAMTAQILYSVE